MSGKIKNIIIFTVSIFFAFASEGPWMFSSDRQNSNTSLIPAAEASEPVSKPAKKELRNIVAYYFNGNFRCGKCKKIEQYSQEAITKYFGKELKNGSLRFTVLNTDLPENKHFIQDYQLVTRSLVIVEFKDGKQVRWNNLGGVWQCVSSKETFLSYVQTEIQKYLKGI